MYDSYHNFNKYVVSNFYETPSTDSKFDKINNFYKDLLKPDNVESKTVDTKQKKANVLKNVTELYNKWIDMYKKEYELLFETKDEDWRKKYDYKNLKDSGYQADKPDEVDKIDKVDKADKVD